MRSFLTLVFKLKSKAGTIFGKIFLNRQKCAQLTTLNLNPFHLTTKKDTNSLSKIYSPYLSSAVRCAGSSLQKASTVGSSVSLSLPWSFSQPLHPKGESKDSFISYQGLLPIIFLLKTLSHIFTLPKQREEAKSRSQSQDSCPT